MQLEVPLSTKQHASGQTGLKTKTLECTGRTLASEGAEVSSMRAIWCRTSSACKSNTKHMLRAQPETLAASGVVTQTAVSPVSSTATIASKSQGQPVHQIAGASQWGATQSGCKVLRITVQQCSLQCIGPRPGDAGWSP